MRTLPVLLFLLLLAAACDLTIDPAPSPGSDEVLYRTERVDRALGAAALPDGSVVVSGLTDGVIGLGDWTNGFPLVLRVGPTGTIRSAAVYRDVRYGEAVAAVPFEDGLAVLVAEANHDAGGFERPDLTLYRTRADGTREEVVYERAGTFPALHPLRRTVDGGFLLALARNRVEDDDLVKLDASGRVAWTYRMPEVQQVVDVAEAPGGDLVVLGVGGAGRFVLARLDAEGRAAWQRTYDDDTFRTPTAVAATADGAVVLGSRVEPGVGTIFLTAVDGAGEVRWERPHATGRVWPSALAALPGGGAAFAYAESYGGPDSGIGQTRAAVVAVSADGTAAWRLPFGPQEGTTYVNALVPLPDGRLAAAGSTGPAFVDGYGGDDFDVLVAFLEPE